MASTQIDSHDLNGDPQITSDQRALFETNGFIRLRNLLEPATVQAFKAPVDEAVRLSRQSAVPMVKRSAYQRAFIQEMNLWQRTEEIRPLVLSTKLAQAAADLMGVDGVRLYHDQALTKEGHGGKTPWHCDQYYWPLNTDRTVTAWIPMLSVPLEMGPLAFAERSHHVDLGRELDISEESEARIRSHRGWRNLRVNVEPMDLGDVSFHLGWTFHGAEANNLPDPRVVFTIIYFADGTTLSTPSNRGQEADRERWIPDTHIGAPAASWLNPLLWSRDGSHKATTLPRPDGRIGTLADI